MMAANSRQWLAAILVTTLATAAPARAGAPCAAQARLHDGLLSARIEGCTLRDTLLLLQARTGLEVHVLDNRMTGELVWAQVDAVPLASAVAKLLSRFSYALHQREGVPVLYVLPDARQPIETALPSHVDRLVAPKRATAAQPAVALTADESRAAAAQLHSIERIAASGAADITQQLLDMAQGRGAATLEARIQAATQLTQQLSDAPGQRNDVKTALVTLSNSDNEAVRAVAQDALLELTRRAR